MSLVCYQEYISTHILCTLDATQLASYSIIVMAYQCNLSLVSLKDAKGTLASFSRVSRTTAQLFMEKAFSSAVICRTSLLQRQHKNMRDERAAPRDSCNSMTSSES